MQTNWQLHKYVLWCAWKIKKKLFFSLLTQGWRVCWSNQIPRGIREDTFSLPTGDVLVAVTEWTQKVLIVNSNWESLDRRIRPNWIVAGHPSTFDLNTIIAHELAHIDDGDPSKGDPVLRLIFQLLLGGLSDQHDAKFCAKVGEFYARLK